MTQNQRRSNHFLMLTAAAALLLMLPAIASARDASSTAFHDLVRVAGNRKNPKAVRASAVKLMASYPGQALVYVMNLITKIQHVC